EKFRSHFESSGDRQRKHVQHWKSRLIEMLESRLLERVLPGKEGAKELDELASAVAKREKDPFTAVSEILARAGLRTGPRSRCHTGETLVSRGPSAKFL